MNKSARFHGQKSMGVLLTDVLIQESIDQFLFRAWAEIAVDSLILLLKTFVGLVEISGT